MDPIETMKIEHDCARLIKIYCHSIDAHDVDKLLSVFAKDGVWQRPGNPPLKGHDEIRAFVESHGAGEVSVHYVTNIVVEVESNTRASSNAYALVFRGAGARENCPLSMTLPRLAVHYQHQFVRADARWLIKRKEIRWLFRKSEN